MKAGEYEVEMKGTREEVLKAVENLPSLIENVHKAFETMKPKTVTTLTVKTGTAKEKASAENHPRIGQTQSCDDAIIQILETDWGKWRPRTMEELGEALKANSLDYSSRVLTGVLMGLVKKGKIRRWNTDTGYVYILVGKEAIA